MDWPEAEIEEIFPNFESQTECFFQSLTPHNSIEFHLKCWITNEGGWLTA